MAPDLTTHPCFNAEARHRFGRVHLPVAPDCNIQCNFCDRRFSCVNESRPGVTAAVLTPQQALEYLHGALARDDRLKVVGIAGPGDPFANPDATLETLRLVRREFPQMVLCIASNGLAIAPYIPELAELGVSHVTLTINAVDPRIGSSIYAWIRDRRIPYHGLEGAQILLDRQLAAVRELHARNIIVKINTILIPGINEHHVGEIARTVTECGANLLNCIPMVCVPETPFGSRGEVDPRTLAAARAEAEAHLPLMQHCTRCRADAIGLLGEPIPDQVRESLLHAAKQPSGSKDDRPYVAVGTLEGVLVNLHLGEARELHIFAANGGSYELVETRETPQPGGGQLRWDALAERLSDCRAILVSSAGPYPRAVFQQHGIQVHMMEGLIDEGLQAVYHGTEIRAPVRRQHECNAGITCGGSGQGCG